jgi:hypothetical protein
MSYQAPHRVKPRASLSTVTIEELVVDPSRAESVASEAVPDLLAEIASREAALRDVQSVLVAAVSVQEPGGNSGKQIRKLPMRNGKVARQQTPIPPICKPYLSIAELAQLTPWTDQAIRTMLSKGMLREGVQFFYVGRRPIFKWAAIVAFIEHPQTTDPVPHYRDQVVNGAKA